MDINELDRNLILPLRGWGKPHAVNIDASVDFRDFGGHRWIWLDGKLKAEACIVTNCKVCRILLAS